MTISQTRQMYSTKKEYQLLLGDQRKRKDRNVRLLAKLENIEKKAAFLQAKTDRIKSLKSFYKSSAVPPVLGHRVSLHDRAPSASTEPVNYSNPYAYEYYRPRYYPPFRESQSHTDSQTSYNVKNVSLDEAIEEISKRFVLIPKTSGSFQTESNFTKPRYPPETTLHKNEDNIKPSKNPTDNDKLPREIPETQEVYSNIDDSHKVDLQNFTNDNDHNLSEEEDSQLSVKENSKKYNEEEISLEKDYVSEISDSKKSVEDLKGLSNDTGLSESTVTNNDIVVPKECETVNKFAPQEKPSAFTLINNICLDSADGNNISKEIDKDEYPNIQLDTNQIPFDNSYADNPSDNQDVNQYLNQKSCNQVEENVYSDQIHLEKNSATEDINQMNAEYEPQDVNNYDGQLPTTTEYNDNEQTLPESLITEPLNENLNDQSLKNSSNLIHQEDAMGQEVPYDMTSNEYPENHQPGDSQFVNDDQYENQPAYDPNQQYYQEGNDESQIDVTNQQYDPNTNNTTAEEIALDNEGNSELNTFSEPNNLNTDPDYNPNETTDQNYNENQEIQDPNYYQGEEYQQENYNTAEMQPNDPGYVNNEEYVDQSQAYVPEGEYSENQVYDQTNNPAEYQPEDAYQENVRDTQPPDETQYADDGQNVQPLKVLESDTEVDMSAREEPSRLESDFDFSSQQ